MGAVGSFLGHLPNEAVHVVQTIEGHALHALCHVADQIKSDITDPKKLIKVVTNPTSVFHDAIQDVMDDFSASIETLCAKLGIPSIGHVVEAGNKLIATIGDTSYQLSNKSFSQYVKQFQEIGSTDGGQNFLTMLARKMGLPGGQLVPVLAKMLGKVGNLGKVAEFAEANPELVDVAAAAADGKAMKRTRAAAEVDHGPTVNGAHGTKIVTHPLDSSPEMKMFGLIYLLVRVWASIVPSPKSGAETVSVYFSTLRKKRSAQRYGRNETPFGINNFWTLLEVQPGKAEGMVASIREKWADNTGVFPSQLISFAIWEKATKTRPQRIAKFKLVAGEKSEAEWCMFIDVEKGVKYVRELNSPFGSTLTVNCTVHEFLRQCHSEMHFKDHRLRTHYGYHPRTVANVLFCLWMILALEDGSSSEPHAVLESFTFPPEIVRVQTQLEGTTSAQMHNPIGADEFFAENSVVTAAYLEKQIEAGAKK